MSMKSTVIERVRRTAAGFTIAELLVSIVVLVIIIFMASQLMTSATAITRTGNKHFDTDTQARVVLDRMALDFAQMVKRTDVDYYIKQPNKYNGHGNGHGCGRERMETRAVTRSPSTARCPVITHQPPQLSKVPFRSLPIESTRATNSSARYGRLERMAKGLRWNGVDNTTDNGATYPIVFATGQIS